MCGYLLKSQTEELTHTPHSVGPSDKKNATTFTLVHRPQNDPLIHDGEASSMVFKPVQSGNQKVKTAHELKTELGESVTSSIRENEGEAANYGIYFDDTKYDYMQHMRDIGISSEAVFVEAPQSASKQHKKKSRQEVALKDAPVPEDLLPKELLPNKRLVKLSYQDQQDIPDALAGLQPDMDLRLREVLEALEDEEYVDNDESLFGELTKSAEEVDESEFYEQGELFDTHGDGEDDDGWATDTTEKPIIKQSTTTKLSESQPPSKPKSISYIDDSSLSADDTSDWVTEYSKFKRAQKSNKNKLPETEIASSFGDLSSTGRLSSIYSRGGSKARQRRKKAAAESVYSMSSSVLQRTEGMSLLDDRFEKVTLIWLLPTPLGAES